MRSEPYKTFRDGRQEASPREYKLRLQIMAERQGWQCAMCTRTMTPPTFDHERGRGMGGYRDDRIEDERGWINAALCLGCNGLKASQRYHWVNGKYVPNIREVQEAA